MSLIEEPTDHSHTVAQLMLYSTLEKSGCQGRLVAIRHLSELQARLEESYRQALFDEEFYEERLTGFDFHPPDQIPDAHSIIVVAYPHPQTRITFTWNDKALPIIIPPTYVYADQSDRRLLDLLSCTLEPLGYHLTEAFVPKKLLAVCSGLGCYGKNNLCYVEGMGSFIRLAAFYSDVPYEEDNWRDPKMMNACQRCSACGNKCPTGAILEGRFLLRAERCITYLNEKPGHIPFPSWLDPSWHNCLVGCMTCQRICPQNKHFLHNIDDGAMFSQEETALLQKGLSLKQLPATMIDKLVQFDLAGFLDIFPRNLSVLLKQECDDESRY